MKLKCCEKEGQCPECKSYNNEIIHEWNLEAAAYKHMFCKDCKTQFIVPYLVMFDEDRPEDEMEVDITYKVEEI